MSLTFLTDFNDPTKTKEFNDPKKLFDPRLNQLYDCAPTFSQIVLALKSICTKENIRKKPTFFQGYVFEMPQRRFIELINEIPDNLVYLLPFFQIVVYGSEYSAYSYTFRLDNSTTKAALVHRSSTSIVRDVNRENFPAKLTEFLSELDRQFEEWAIHGQKLFVSEYGPYESNVWQLIRFLNGTLPFFSNGRRLEPNAVKQLILESRNVQLQVDTASNIWNSFHLVVPVSEGNREPLFRNLSHGANVCQVLETSIARIEASRKKEKGVITYGVELELCTNHKPKDLIEAQRNLFFILKDDSSITGNKAFRSELVTVPLTLKEHKINWEEWCSRVVDDNEPEKMWDVSTKTNNGMHVHISRDHFSETHLTRFAWFLVSPANLPFTIAVSERDLDSFNRWSRAPSFERVTKTRAIKEVIERCSAHRGCLNVGTNKGTYEVRMFKGIVSFATIMKNLEFVDAVYHFTLQASLNNLRVSDFIEWVNKTPKNKYLALKKFLEKINLSKIIEESNLVSWVFAETKPEKIVEIVNSKGITVVQEHVIILNRMRGEKLFVLHGKKLAIRRPTDRAKLYKFDTALRERYAQNRIRQANNQVSI